MDQSNKPKASIEFDIEDIPVMWHALNLQSSTDMVYGQEGHISRGRFKERANHLKEQYPLLCHHDMKEYGWLNAATAARTCKELSITQKVELDWGHYRETNYTEKRANKDWLRTHPIVIVVDDNAYKISDRIPYDKTYLEGLLEILSQITPVDAKLHPIAETRLD